MATISPDAAEQEFLARLGIQSGACINPPVIGAIWELLNFYEAVPAAGCAPERGDMLLFQWGVFDWGEGPRFEVDLVRQFIASDLEDDDAISQLHFTMRFPVSPTVQDLGSGNRWCKSKDELQAFRQYLESHPVIRVVPTLHAEHVVVAYEYV